MSETLYFLSKTLYFSDKTLFFLVFCTSWLIFIYFVMKKDIENGYLEPVSQLFHNFLRFCEVRVWAYTNARKGHVKPTKAMKIQENDQNPRKTLEKANKTTKR